MSLGTPTACNSFACPRYHRPMSFFAVLAGPGIVEQLRPLPQGQPGMHEALIAWSRMDWAQLRCRARARHAWVVWVISHRAGARAGGLASCMALMAHVTARCSRWCGDLIGAVP